MNETDYGKIIGKIIKDCFIHKGWNPDKVWIAQIETIYGHKVRMEDLIKLIETSEVK